MLLTLVLENATDEARYLLVRDIQEGKKKIIDGQIHIKFGGDFKRVEEVILTSLQEYVTQLDEEAKHLKVDTNAFYDDCYDCQTTREHICSHELGVSCCYLCGRIEPWDGEE